MSVCLISQVNYSFSVIIVNKTTIKHSFNDIASNNTRHDVENETLHQFHYNFRVRLLMQKLKMFGMVQKILYSDTKPVHYGQRTVFADPIGILAYKLTLIH